MKTRHVELLIVLVAALTPQFLLASEINGDEFAKSTSGAVLAGIILGIYRVWRGGEKTPENPENV